MMVRPRACHRTMPLALIFILVIVFIVGISDHTRAQVDTSNKPSQDGIITVGPNSILNNPSQGFTITQVPSGGAVLRNAAPMQSSEGGGRGAGMGEHPTLAQCQNLLRRAALVPSLINTHDYSYCNARSK
jgi:hypothetical protein